MKSRHVDLYNHDDEAATYDEEVRTSRSPIREGYGDVLDWVVRQAEVQPDSTVVELGSGTGNLTKRLPGCARIECVDVSTEMTALARRKLESRRNVTFVHADFLEYFDRDRPAFDILVSTYSIHHLTSDEKHLLFDRIASSLKPGGRAVFGDLMVADASSETALIESFRSEGDLATARDIEEEFFWNVETDPKCLRDLGFRVEAQQLSRLSWGIRADKCVSRTVTP